MKLRGRRRPKRSLGPALAGSAATSAEQLVENIRRGRFEKMMCALTSAGAVVSGLEIMLEHDRASFGNSMMWVPVALSPVVAAAGLAGVFSERSAKVALPIASGLVLANSVQGQYLHVRGIAQRPGGWKLARYNSEMGPPLFAPLLFGLVGGMGLLAALLRREGSR